MAIDTSHGKSRPVVTAAHRETRAQGPGYKNTNANSTGYKTDATKQILGFRFGKYRPFPRAAVRSILLPIPARATIHTTYDYATYNRNRGRPGTYNLLHYPRSRYSPRLHTRRAQKT